MVTIRQNKLHNNCAGCRAWNKNGACNIGFDNGHDEDCTEDTRSERKPTEPCPKPRSNKEVEYFAENGIVLSNTMHM